MFVEIDSSTQPHAEPAGHAPAGHGQLSGTERQRFLALLDEHLHTARQICGLAREVRWKLGKLSYRSLKALFRQLDESSQAFAVFVQKNIEMLDGTLLPMVPLDTVDQPPGFRECFKQIHALAEQSTALVERTRRYMDGAVERGEYASANLISELLYRANQLISQITLEIPSGEPFISECQAASRPHSYFSTFEVWAHNPQPPSSALQDPALRY